MNSERDALSLEYKRDYGCARGKLELSDLVNHPPIASEFRRLGLQLPEKTFRLVLGDTRPLSDYICHTPLIGSKAV